MRLFIAINFSPEIIAELLALRDALRIQSERGNFSPPENLHLTLAFLGECDARQAAMARQAMARMDFNPPEIAVDRVGRFRREGGDIWWAGVRESGALLALQRSLAGQLRSRGFALEQRRYSPHITLGREIVTAAQPWVIAPFGETAESIALMKSERIRGKLIYTAIYEHPPA